MEGAGPDVVGLVPQHGGEAILELTGGLIREGDGEDPPGLHRVQRGKARRLRPALLQQAQHLLVRAGRQLIAVGGAAVAEEVRDAVDEHRGLAAPGPGQDQQRALRRQHGLLLSFVQIFKIRADQRAARFQEALFKCSRHAHDFTTGPAAVQVPFHTEGDKIFSRRIAFLAQSRYDVANLFC